jgi:two-component system LytT family response regulator
MNAEPLRAYLVDDEPLALKRLASLLSRDPRVTIVGTQSDPAAALGFLCDRERSVDVLFLDVQMPAMTGFELCRRLPEKRPWVVFVTAHNEHALRAFEVSAIDYLVKPVEEQALDRALEKIGRVAGTASAPTPASEAVLDRIEKLMTSRSAGGNRLASRLGSRVVFVEVEHVTHVVSEDKIVCAMTEDRGYVVDSTVSELEARLESAGFFRIHRATLVNLAWVTELFVDGGEGGTFVRLRDSKASTLAVSRERVRALKQRLGVHGA